jgi:hypothetical protein
VLPGDLLPVGVARPWSVGCERSGSTRIFVKIFHASLGEAILIALRLRLRRWSDCRFEYGTLLAEEFVKLLGEVAQQVPAVCNLGGLRCTCCDAFPADMGAVAADHLYVWVLRKPLRQRLYRMLFK